MGMPVGRVMTNTTLAPGKFHQDTKACFLNPDSIPHLSKTVGTIRILCQCISSMWLLKFPQSTRRGGTCLEPQYPGGRARRINVSLIKALNYLARPCPYPPHSPKYERVIFFFWPDSKKSLLQIFRFYGFLFLYLKNSIIFVSFVH